MKRYRIIKYRGMYAIQRRCSLLFIFKYWWTMDHHGYGIIRYQTKEEAENIIKYWNGACKENRIVKELIFQ